MSSGNELCTRACCSMACLMMAQPSPAVVSEWLALCRVPPAAWSFTVFPPIWLWQHTPGERSLLVQQHQGNF